MNQNLISNDYLIHYGVKGMKWGVRHDPEIVGRQSLRKRYYNRKANALQRDIDSFKGHENGISTKSGKQVLSKKDVSDITKSLQTEKDKALNKANTPLLTDKQKQTAKKIAIGAAVVAGVGLAAYGGYKVSAIRSYNKASVAKFLEKHTDVRAAVANGGSFKYQMNTPGITGGMNRFSMSTNATKAKNTILGPQLKGSRSTVEKVGAGTLRGEKTTKQLDLFSVGRKGRNNYIIMPKDDKRYYKNLYNTRYKMFFK